VIVLPAQVAVTPAGSPVATPIPLAPVVVCVIFGMAVLIQTVGVEDAADTVLFGVTVIIFDANAFPQEPPDVVNPNVAVPENPAGGVHVAFKVVVFGLNVPPAVADHVPPVAPPPTEAPRATVVPPWQMAAIAGPMFTVGTGFTVTSLLAEVVPQEPPLVVNVSVAVPENPAGGVHVAFKVVAFGLNVPPAGVDHVPPVAPPPTEAPRATVVPPWQMAAIAGPMFTVGAGFTIIVFDAEADPQEPPVVVSDNVAVPV
jgi:hypothetical protein